MAISGDYPSPVTVNGYSCRTCSDVDRAKRFIDPAHPQAGPFGIDANKTTPGHFAATARDPLAMAVMAGARAVQSASPIALAYHGAATPGTLVDLTA